jgi:chloramphenicol O-acetyltransferase type A
MTYRIVETYHRQRHFDFFKTYRNPFYAVTLELDITELKRFTDDAGYPIYLNLCYFFTRAMHDVEDFHYRVRDGVIVRYDRLEVAATLPSPDGLFSFGYFGYDPDCARFNLSAREIDAATRQRTTLSQPHQSNHVLFTALPKVRFTGFTHATPDDSLDGRPRVAFGKFETTDGRLTLPVGLEVNHALIDGNAVGDLVERVEEVFDDPS